MKDPKAFKGQGTFGTVYALPGDIAMKVANQPIEKCQKEMNKYRNMGLRELTVQSWNTQCLERGRRANENELNKESPINDQIYYTLPKPIIDRYTLLLDPLLVADIYKANNLSRGSRGVVFNKLCVGEAKDVLKILKSDALQPTYLDWLFDRVFEAGSTVLSAMHESENPMYHRDIKPENIMICKNADGTYHAKIVDFGLACAKSNFRPFAWGTAEFSPPNSNDWWTNLIQYHFANSGIRIDDYVDVEYLDERTWSSGEYADKFALACTLVEILGKKLKLGQRIKPTYVNVVKLLFQGAPWSTIKGTYDASQPSSIGLADRRVLGGKAVQTWTSTGQKVTLKDGRVRTVYENTAGERRIRRKVEASNGRPARFVYSKFDVKSL